MNIEKTKVSLLSCPDYDDDKVYRSLIKAIDLIGGLSSFIKKGDKVLLKPNLVSAKPPEKAVTTHPKFVEAVIRIVKEAGAIPHIGDSPSLGDLSKVTTICGIGEVAKRHGVKIVDFNEGILVDNRKGIIFKRLEVAKEIFDYDIIINLPKVKTHLQMLLTLAVKNLFGVVIGKRKAEWHLKAGIDQEFFASLLLDLYLLVDPGLTIVDGIIGMEGNGPSNGEPRKLGIILAGTDAVAIDSVICQILGVRKEDYPILKMAESYGIGKRGPEDIEILGERGLSIGDFRLPGTYDIGFGLPYPLTSLLKKVISSKPKVDKKMCKICLRCVEHCPPKAMKKNKERILIDNSRCIRCYCCSEVCPEGAIKIKRGLFSS